MIQPIHHSTTNVELVKSETKQIIRLHRSNSTSNNQPNKPSLPNQLNDDVTTKPNMVHGRVPSMEAWSAKSSNENASEKPSPSTPSNRPSVGNGFQSAKQTISRSNSRPSSISSKQSTNKIARLSIAQVNDTRLQQAVRSIFQSINFLRLLFTFRIILNPFSKGKRAFDLLVICMVIYTAFIVPFYIGFDPDLSTTLLPLDTICTIAMALDIFVTARTGFLDSAGNICYDSRVIARRYWKRGLLLDVIGTVPLEIFESCVTSSNTRIVHLLKVNGLLRASRLAYNDRLAAFNSPTARIAKLLFMFFYMAHLFACTFFFVTFIEPDTATWVAKAGLGTQSIARQYVASLYWSLTTMTTIGYGDITPVTVYEQAVVIPILLLSALIYATIFSNMAYAIETITSTIRRYQSRMDQVKEFVNVYDLPRELKNKLFSYQNAAWNQNKGFEMDTMLSHLPLSVRAEVMLCINESLIERVPLLKQCSDRFLEAIVLRMSTQVCLPGDFVCRQGDKSTEMYFIRTGSVDVLMMDENGHEETIAQLRSTSDSPFFGETSLLLGEPRTASVKATTKCVLSTLSQEHFFEVMSMFPEDASSLRDAACERIQADLERENAAIERAATLKTLKKDSSSSKGDETNGKPSYERHHSKHKSRLDILAPTVAAPRFSAAAAPIAEKVEPNALNVEVAILQKKLDLMSSRLDLAIGVIHALSHSNPAAATSPQVEKALRALAAVDK